MCLCSCVQDTLSSQGGRKPALSNTWMGSGVPAQHNRPPLVLLSHRELCQDSQHCHHSSLGIYPRQRELSPWQPEAQAGSPAQLCATKQAVSTKG